MVVLVLGFSTGKIDIGNLELRRSFMPGETPYIKVFSKFEARPGYLNICRNNGDAANERDPRTETGD